MSGKSMTLQVGRIVTYVLIVLLLVGVVGFVAYFTNGFSEGFKTFYAKVNGETVLDGIDGVVVSQDEPLKVDVRYTFGAFSKKQTGFEIEIHPDADFTFFLDGSAHSFAEVEELKGGFEIVEDENSVTIIPRGGVESILRGAFPESTIIVDRDSVPADTDLFTVVIYSFDRKSSVFVCCRLKDLFIEGVTLDKEAIEF